MVIGSGAWDSAKVADQMYHLDPDCKPFAGYGVGANLAGLLGQTLLWLDFPRETLEGEWWMDAFGKNSL